MKWLIILIVSYPIFGTGQSVQNRINQIKQENDLLSTQLMAFKDLREEYLDHQKIDSIGHVSYYISSWSLKEQLYEDTKTYAHEAIEIFRSTNYSNYRLHNCYYQILKANRKLSLDSENRKYKKEILTLPIDTKYSQNAFILVVTELCKSYLAQGDLLIT